MDQSEIPGSLIERVKMMESILISVATGGDYKGENDRVYQILRREFMNNPGVVGYLPSFVRTHRTLPAFWPFIRDEAGTYADRRQLISNSFNDLADRLESASFSPGDAHVKDVLDSLGSDSVSAIWAKALVRRDTDPEGAITLARTLLEAIAKRILDDLEGGYSSTDDLPKLYNRAAKALNLAPSQHSQEPIRAILGGVMTVVNGIGTLRNRLSDAHAPSDPLPVRPSKRHATLAVNIAGAVAAFLVETHSKRPQP